MKAMLSYPQHDRFVDPARRSSGLNHTLVGFVAIEFFYAICRHATDYVIVQTLPDLSEEILSRVTARAMIIDLFAFLFLGLTVIWVVWRTHGRGPATLFGPTSIFWSDLLRASLGAGALFLVLEFVLPWWRADHVDMQPLQAWAATLPLALMHGSCPLVVLKVGLGANKAVGVQLWWWRGGQEMGAGVSVHGAPLPHRAPLPDWLPLPNGTGVVR